MNNDIGFPNVNRYLDKPLSLQSTEILKLWRLRPKIYARDVLDLTLDAWQEDVAELYTTNQRVGLIASKGPGKMEPLDRIIYTPKGKVKFGDLKPNDEVFSEYGTPTKVTAIYPQGVMDIYEVTFDDGTSAQVGGEHLWKVRGTTEKRRKTWSVQSTFQLMERGISRYQGSQLHFQFQIPAQGKAQFPHNPNLADPYTIGVWLGDGTKGHAQYSKPDQEVQDRISKHYKTKRLNSQRCPNITIPEIKNELKRTMLIGTYSYQRFIPEDYKTASIAQRTALLHGLMDTDGTIDKRDGCVEFNTSSKQLAEDVQWLVRSLGGKSTIKTKRAFIKDVEHRLCYRVRVTTPFNPFHLSRKAKYWHKPTQERYFQRTIKRIELVGKKEAMCISVACENRCYLTNDFIVTHNTFCIAFLGMHFFTTRHMPKMAAISVTEGHLKSNLWAELLKMRMRSEVLKKSITDGASKIALIGHEGYSFIDARSYPKQADENTMASALAGLHADNVAFLIDEAGTIPDSVLATADAALSTGDSEMMSAKILATGNPEVAKGILYRAYMGRTRQKWAIYTVSGDPEDPKRAPRVSKDWAQEQIDTYGKDDPWVMVNVFGKYPITASNTLLSEEEIHDSMNRTIEEKKVKDQQHRLGVDVARGGIDRTVFARRRGLKCYPLEAIGSDIYGPELAGKIAFLQQDQGIERVFVDNTGGYGSSVIDSLSLFPHLDVTPVVYNAKSQDKRYFNKRTEMWVRLRDWVKKGGCLPNDPGLAEELMMPKLIFHGGIFRLEEKEQIKARLGRSPDKADALAQTFADVDQPSFFGDFSGTTAGQAHMSDEEFVENYHRMRQGNYVSDQSHIDKYFRPSPNYRS